MADKSLTVVLKADAALKEKLRAFYADDFCDKVPQYAAFQAKVDDCTVTLYDSGKLMFQGKRAEEESSIWSSLGAGEAPAKKKQEKTTKVSGAGKSGADGFSDTTAVGSDEVGTGDFFGPIVVTAAYVRKEQFSFLCELGVRDSKKLTDEKIMRIAPQIMEQIPHVTRVLSNPEYNEMRAREINMNQIKALLHNECLFRLLRDQKVEPITVVVDQFEPPAAYYKHIAGEANKVEDICFMTKAEDKCLAVACGSIISRYTFLIEMKKLGEAYGILEEIPFGAGVGVDAFGAELVREHGEEILTKVAKMNFANVEKVRQLL